LSLKNTEPSTKLMFVLALVYSHQCTLVLEAQTKFIPSDEGIINWIRRFCRKAKPYWPNKEPYCDTG